MQADAAFPGTGVECLPVGDGVFVYIVGISAGKGETSDVVTGVDDVGVMAGILGVFHALGLLLVIALLFGGVPAVERVVVEPREILADAELLGVAFGVVVVGPVHIGLRLCHEHVGHLQRGLALLGAQLVALPDVLQAGLHVLQAGRVTVLA